MGYVCEWIPLREAPWDGCMCVCRMNNKRSRAANTKFVAKGGLFVTHERARKWANWSERVQNGMACGRMLFWTDEIGIDWQRHSH